MGLWILWVRHQDASFCSTDKPNYFPTIHRCWKVIMWNVHTIILTFFLLSAFQKLNTFTECCLDLSEQQAVGTGWLSHLCVLCGCVSWLWLEAFSKVLQLFDRLLFWVYVIVRHKESFYTNCCRFVSQWGDLSSLCQQQMHNYVENICKSHKQCKIVISKYTETVTAYITKCIDDVTVTKTITVRANQKPWLTGEVYRLLNARNAAFRAGDEEGLRKARANLSRGIREAKRQYSRRIAHRFSDSRDTRSLWQGIQTITDYKPPPQTCDSTIPLLNELNAFFARFEAQNSTTAQKTPPPPGDQVMTLSSDSVRRSLSRINARKAPGPDNIPGRVLRDCAVELTDVFTDIFNISLSQAVVPTCFKATTIIPVPKKSSPSCFNDYRPVALTPIPMKCFERLVMQHIKSVLPPLPGPLPVCI